MDWSWLLCWHTYGSGELETADRAMVASPLSLSNSNGLSNSVVQRPFGPIGKDVILATSFLFYQSLMTQTQ